MNEEGYRLIIEELLKLLDEGVYIVDQKGIGLFYNKAMANIEHIHVQDVIGKEYHKAFRGVKIEDSTLFRALKKGLKSEAKEQTYNNLYGKEVSTINATVPIVQDGEVVAAVEVAKDITSLKDMSDTILKLHEKQPGIKPKTRVSPSIKRYTFDDIIGENPEFQKALREAYKADCQTLDFGQQATLDYMNQWCSEQTKGFIPKVM